jgi:hypothetical protein
MKFENAIIYNGKFYRAGEEVPVAEKIEKATDKNTTVETDEKVEDSTDEKVEDSTDESTTTEKVSKRRTKPKTEVN